MYRIRRLSDKLRGMPVLAIRPDEIDARLYNMWRRLRLRTGPHVEFPLHGLSGMRLILEDDAWCVVDETRHDVPVLAWTDFAALKSRQSLHEPIACRLNHFHYMATSLRGPTLDRLEGLLASRLSRR